MTTIREMRHSWRGWKTLHDLRVGGNPRGIRVFRFKEDISGGLKGHVNLWAPFLGEQTSTYYQTQKHSNWHGNGLSLASLLIRHQKGQCTEIFGDEAFQVIQHFLDFFRGVAPYSKSKLSPHLQKFESWAEPLGLLNT